MSQSLIDSLVALGSIQVLGWIVAGTALGYWVGILPGVGGIVAMALLLPLTLVLNPYEALGLLLSMYAVISITGDLTAILIGVPGSPSSAPMALDGYGMAKRGQATLAMSAAVISSLLGALFGALVLLFTIPIMRPLVLALGSAEVFMLTMLGMAMVSSLSNRGMLKGLTTGALGLLLASVGPAVGVGTMRFTFGQLYLLDGIGLVPLAIGIFAIPELIDIHRNRSSIAQQAATPLDEQTLRRQGAFSAWGEVVARRWLLLRTSIIGLSVGVIPGLGGAVAAWMAYGHAAQTTKDPLFGTASLDGVVGPGAANNSKEGGGLIPTIAFGVPGTAMMAVLLGALVMLGIQPGPAMVERNLDLSYFMVWVLVLGNVLGAGMAFLTLRQLGRITFIRGTFLVPFVAAFVIIGAGAASRQVGDLIAVTVFGLLAYVLRSNDWPVVPLLLGFVLGPRMEASLNLAVRLHGASWLTNPIVVFLIIACSATIIAGYRTSMRKGGANSSLLSAESEKEPLRSPFVDLAITVTLLVLGATATLYASRWGVQARLMPMGSGGLLVGLAFLVLIVHRPGAHRSARTRARQRTVRDSESSAISVEAFAESSSAKSDLQTDVMKSGLTPKGSPLVLVVYFVSFITSTWLVGMTVSLPIMTFIYYRAVARVSTRQAIVVAAAATALYWFIFEYLLGVPSVRPLLL